jgi:hypothetical protein
MAVNETALTGLGQALATVEFVVSRQGETRGVFLPLAVWEAVLEALEDVEDLDVARDYLTRRAVALSPEDMGLLDWEDVATEWDDDEAPEA